MDASPAIFLWVVEDDLKKVPLFREFSDEELGRLAKYCVEEPVRAGDYLFRQGDAHRGLLIIKSGSAEVLRDEEGRPMELLGRVGPSDFLGESGLFSEPIHGASARAAEPSVVLTIASEDLAAFLKDHPHVELKLQMAAARRHAMNAAAALDLGWRGDVRIRVEREVELELDSGRRVSCLLMNLSKGGLCVRHPPRHWRQGVTVRFDVELAGVSLSVVGKVSWRSGDLVGVIFTGTDGGGRDGKIREVLRRLQGPKAR